MLRDLLELEADLHNLGEALKLRRSTKVELYIKNLEKEIDERLQIIQRKASALSKALKTAQNF